MEGKRRVMGLRSILLILILCVAPPAFAPPAFAPPAFAASGSLWSVGEAGGKLLSLPADDAPALAALSSGQRLIEFERQGPWLRVAVMGAVGLEGWVLAKELEASSPRQPGGGSEALPEEAPGEDDQEPGRRDAGNSHFRLSVEGSPALAFSVKCSLYGASGVVRTLRYKGFVPKRYGFRGTAIACLISKQDARGRLDARLSNQTGTLAKALTRAPYNFVRLRSAGPWGRARGTRGAIPLVKIQKTGRQRTVPHLPTPLVPPLRKP
jgi:hypothetical protein